MLHVFGRIGNINKERSQYVRQAEKECKLHSCHQHAHWLAVDSQGRARSVHTWAQSDITFH